MRDELKKDMSEKMNIRRFINETECEFNQRLIYSAGAAWVKTLVYGYSYTNSNLDCEFVNNDIMYIESHLSKVIEAYLKCFDINIDWIEKNDICGDVEKSRAMASQIIKDTINTYSVAQVMSRRITPIKKKLYKYGENLYLVRGEVPMDKTIYSVGAVQWIVADNIDNYELDKKIVSIPVKNYYEIIDKEFIWKEKKLHSDFLIFRTGSKGSYSKCWRSIEVSDIPQGINILKLDSTFSGGYILVKKNNNKLLVSELDPWYIEEKEIYRILYTLNYKKNSPAEFKVIKREEHYILRYSSAIPNYENRIISSCSWPYVTYDDKYSKIVPDFLWGVVKNLLRDLEIKIIYQ
jgi:hypothetical protein